MRITFKKITMTMVAAFFVPIFFVGAVNAADYTFPIIGESSFSNDFNAPRADGPHHAIDIIADKHQKVVSRTDGLVTFVGYPEPSWGYAVFIRADNGYTYRYLHLNNDNPGTDDGNGGGYNAYGPDIVPGNRVVRGQLLGYVGDSGNAENTVPHLHFEAYDGDKALNPYYGLVNNSDHISKPKDNYPLVEDEILPFTTSFRGGATIALGDVDDDGVDEIITGAGPGGTYVKVFELDGTLISSFRPNSLSFKGGIDVASGDVDDDGVDEIITGAGPGGTYVKVFELDGTGIGGFRPYGNFSRGISVATGDVAGLTEDEIITGTRKGGGPRVSVFNLGGAQLDTYYAYGSAFKGGIRVESANIHASVKDEILTIPREGGSARVKAFSSSGAALDASNYFAEVWWKGYYDIAASESSLFSSLGIDRRTSLRAVNGIE
jgi:hypothetical protein